MMDNIFNDMLLRVCLNETLILLKKQREVIQTDDEGCVLFTPDFCL